MLLIKWLFFESIRAFGMTVKFEDVAHQGIRKITPEDVTVAQQLGYVVKLVGSYWRNKNQVFCCRSHTDFFYQNLISLLVWMVMNAVFVDLSGW